MNLGDLISTLHAEFLVLCQGDQDLACVMTACTIQDMMMDAQKDEEPHAGVVFDLDRLDEDEDEEDGEEVPSPLGGTAKARDNA